jgi:HEAT repeat protein
VNIRALSVEEALRVILIGHDAFFLYSAEASGRASLRSVWAYRKGEATGFQPAAPEALQSAKEIRVQLQDSNPRTRTRAFRALLERTGSEAAEAVAATVMQERDDAVRGSMIEAVRSSGIELPAEMWGSLTADPAEHIRLLALDALQGAPGLREFATTALSDSSPHVRQRAQEIINELEAASGVTRSAP